ncbi:DUF1656 domain-containing protein [Parathalassolituus penaei]|uniref:DUF1656 domain-containing protein n=1 Tax=Parathalassolituus penaei TaxID=2997323 RepID=A0A9X3EGV2_9GAMM|nr:DUF1656 domain-containing protein [Parathalassolituus penaei]MCY0967317.1 DUF1656 domain-containing protein [Parathalassolituus penaei]
MLHEIPLFGVLFSPLVVFVPLALLMLWLTQWLMQRLNLRRWLWKPAWFDLSLLVCYLGLVVWIWGA